MVQDWITPEVLQALEKLDLKIVVRTVPEIEMLLGKTVLFRGKKFRPTLCFLMSQLFGVPLDVAHPYARAAEFTHAATLAHDDVIDESPTRRNRPTLNARSSNARAVLAGDLLLARVMYELSGLGRIEVIHDLARTVEELVSGEWLQLEARKIAGVNRAHLETVAQKKTASLMSWSCVVAAHLAQTSVEIREACYRFGESLGIAFQMIDDIIDYDKKGEKPFAQDIREGLVNFVTLEMLEANPSLREPIERLLGREEFDGNWPWKDQELSLACDRVRSRAQAKLEAADLFLAQIFRGVPNPDVKAHQALNSILVYLKERVR